MIHLKGAGNVIEGLAAAHVNGVLSRVALPSSDGCVYVERINFDSIADPSHPLGRDEGSAGTKKNVKNDLSAGGAVEQGVRYERDGFHRRM